MVRVSYFRKIVCFILTVIVFVGCFGNCNEISSVEAAGVATKNMKRLTRAIKNYGDYSTTGSYFLGGVYDYNDRVSVYRESSTKVSVIYRSEDDIFVSFDYKVNSKKINIHVISEDFSVDETITVSKFSGKKNQIKIKDVDTFMGRWGSVSVTYAKKKAYTNTLRAMRAFNYCIYMETGYILKDIGFKKYKRYS